MNNVISCQKFKFLKSSAFFVMMVLAPFIAGFLYAAYRLANPDLPGADYYALDVMLTSMDGDIIFLIVGILGALLISMDFSSTSIRQIIGKGTKRLNYTLGTVLTSFMVSILPVFLMCLSLFVIGLIAFGQVGSTDTMTIVWVILGLLVSSFWFTSFNMFIGSLTKKTSLTVIFAILTPTLIRIFVALAEKAAKRELPIDPITALNNIVYQDVCTSTKICSVIGFVVAGLVFTILSIIVVKKKEY